MTEESKENWAAAVATEVTHDVSLFSPVYAEQQAFEDAAPPLPPPQQEAAIALPMAGKEITAPELTIMLDDEARINGKLTACSIF